MKKKDDVVIIVIPCIGDCGKITGGLQWNCRMLSSDRPSMCMLFELMPESTFCVWLRMQASFMFQLLHLLNRPCTQWKVEFCEEELVTHYEIMCMSVSTYACQNNASMT